MSAHAALASGALDVDVLVHALDVADGGVDAGGDGFNLQRDGVQTSVQRVEALPSPVLIVPEGDTRRVFGQGGHLSVCLFVARARALFLLPGVVAQVMHVLLVFIHDSRCVVQLHLQVHHLDKRQRKVLEAARIKGNLPSTGEEIHTVLGRSLHF